MPETIASLAVRIGADLSGLTSGLQQAQSKLQSVSDKMGQIGKRLTMTVTAPLVGLGVAVTKAAMNWESAFAGVIKTVDGTDEQLSALEDQLLRTSRQMPISPEQIARIGELGGQLGVQIGDIDAFAQEIAKLGVSTDMAVDDAAMGMARFLNITKKIAPEGATFMTQLQAVGATLVDLGNNFAATESEIMEFSLRIAGAGTVVGLTQDEILGWSVALASMGINVEAGGTAISRIFLEISNAVQGATGAVIDNSAEIEKSQAKLDKLRQQLQLAAMHQSEYTEKTKESTRVANEFKIENLTAQIQDQESALNSLVAAQGKMAPAGKEMALIAKVAGTSIEEFSFLMKENASKATAMFIAGLGKMQESGENILPILEALQLSDIRVRDTLLRLSSSTEVLDKALGAAGDAYGDMNALNVEAAKRFKTTESQIQIVKNTFHYLAVIIGKQVLPVIIDVLGKVGPLVEKFAEFIKVNPKIIKFGLALAAVAAAVGPVMMFLGVMLPIVSALVSPLGLVIAGVVALTAEFVKAEGGIGPAIKAIIDKIKDIAKAVKAGDWSAVWEELKGVGATITGIVGGWIDEAKRIAGEKWEAFKTNLGERVGSLKADLVEKWGTLKDVFTSEGFVAAVETALSFAGVKIDFSDLKDDLRAKWNAVAMIFKEKGFVEAVETALLFAGVVVDFSALREKVAKAWENMWLGTWEKTGEKLKVGDELLPVIERTGGLKTKIEGMATSIWEAFAEQFPESAAIAEEAFGALYTKVEELIGKLRELVGVVSEDGELPVAIENGIVATIRDLLNLQMDNAYSRVESLKGILEASKDIFTSIGDLMGIVGNNTEGWNEALETLKDWLPDILDWLNPWDNILAAIKDHLENIASGLRTVIKLRNEWRQGREDGEGGENGISTFQRGGVVSRSGVALVGESGPELAWLPRATKVSSAAETRGMLAGQKAGPTTIFEPGSIVIHADGLGPEEVKRATADGVMAALQAAGMAW